MATKEKKRRPAKNLDVLYIGGLPDWSTIKDATDPKFPDMFTGMLRTYGYFNNVKDGKKAAISWLASIDYDVEKIKAFKISTDWRMPMTACAIAHAFINDMPVLDNHKAYVLGHINSAISFNLKDGNVSAEVVEKQAKNKPTIQDRIAEKVNMHVGYFEVEFEDGIIERKETHPKPDALTYLRKNEVPASIAKSIATHFQKNWDEVTNKANDEQIEEAYAHLKKSDIKRFTDFYKALLDELEMYQAEKKVAKAPRKKKPVAKSKQVAKLKFALKHDGLKLVSIAPTDIIDTKVLWVYNTKTRKLGSYIAGEYETLGVKGASIVGFDPIVSIAKTLRKPKEQLATFKKAGKVPLRKFLTDIKAVDIKLNGRINTDTILLRVY